MAESIADPPARKAWYGKRIFDLNLSDRVEGVWDEHVPQVQQCTMEAVGVDANRLDSASSVRKIADRLATEFHLTIVGEAAHEFPGSPVGITVVYLLSESHIAIHTWPEKGYVHVDLVTCSKRGVDPERATGILRELLEPTSVRTHKIYY